MSEQAKDKLQLFVILETELPAFITNVRQKDDAILLDLPSRTEREDALPYLASGVFSCESFDEKSILIRFSSELHLSELEQHVLVLASQFTGSLK